MPVGSTGGVISDLGVGAVPVSPATIIGDLFSGGAIPAAQQVVFSNGTLLTGAAGLAIVGTPSATAPSTGTNGAGLLNGIVHQQDAGSSNVIAASFGNGSATSGGYLGYAAQGSAASPGATILNDTIVLGLRGHDGTNFTTSAARIELIAGSTWSGSNRETFIQFRTTPNGSTSQTTAGRIDPNQTLCWGGAFNSVGTFSAGTQRPHIQTSSTSTANANVAQSLWANSTAGPTGILAKSRSGTVGTQGVITTGDTLGTMSWQGDDGTNFIAAAQIDVAATGTVGTGQVPGVLRLRTANSSGTMATGYVLDSTQVSCFSNGSTNTSQALFTSAAVTPRVQVTGTTAALPASVSIAQFQNATGAGSLYFGKTRSGTVGTMTVVTTGDALGTLDWQGSDGTNFVSAAQIGVTCTGTIASTRVPGNLVISTGTDAAPTVMTAALTINNAQVITHNSTTEASAVGTASTVLLGGLGVAKRSFLGTIGTSFSGNVVAGVQDGTADTSGAVGEVVQGTNQSTYTNFTTSNTLQQLAVLTSLPRGRWRIVATVTYYGNAATVATLAEAQFAISTTTASTAGAVEGRSIAYLPQQVTSSLHNTDTFETDVNLSAATSYFLNGKATFSAGNPQFVASLTAYRLR